MQISTKFLIVLAVFFFSFFYFTNITKAETEQTTFYFQKDSQPLNQPVKFFIKCYEGSGYSGGGPIVQSSEFSGICLTYGCRIDTLGILEYGGWHNYGSEGSGGKYCNLEAEINGSNFTINNIIKFVAPTGPIKGVNSEYSCRPKRTCEIKINITDVNINIPDVEATPSIKLSQHKSTFGRIINFFKCSFLRIFGKSC